MAYEVIKEVPKRLPTRWSFILYKSYQMEANLKSKLEHKLKSLDLDLIPPLEMPIKHRSSQELSEIERHPNTPCIKCLKTFTMATNGRNEWYLIVVAKYATDLQFYPVTVWNLDSITSDESCYHLCENKEHSLEIFDCAVYYPHKEEGKKA